MLTNTELDLLKAGLEAETDPQVVSWVTNRNDVQLADYCNTASAVDAWDHAMDAPRLYRAMDITEFDGLTPGKRDAWRLVMDMAIHVAPVDWRQNQNRQAIIDCWGAASGVPLLQKCLRKALKGEFYLGGTNKTTQGVSGLSLNYAGFITSDDIARAFNPR